MKALIMSADHFEDSELLIPGRWWSMAIWSRPGNRPISLRSCERP